MKRRIPTPPRRPRAGLQPEDMALATRAIHGTKFHPFQGPVVPPLVQTSTYRFADSSDAKRYADGDTSVYVYTRYHNPTVHDAQERLAATMGAERALLFSSGMAAITSTIFSLVRAGDRMISTPSLYGGTYRFFRDILPAHGVRVDYVEPDHLEAIVDRSGPRTRLVYFETPTNPSLGIVDIRRCVEAVRRAERRHRTRIVTVIDNTFATVVNQQPLHMGVDLIVESATKYLGGHSDIVAGVTAGSSDLIQDVHTQLKYLGGCADPFAAFLLARSLKTFALRVQRQNENAMALAEFLERHPKVRQVLYPGLPSHPGHAIARQQMVEAGGLGYGGMVTVDLKGGVRSAVRVCDRLNVAVNAMSLGGAETLVSIPVYSSHVRMSRRELARHNVSPGMIRISVGVEGIDDLKRDFADALRKA